MRFFAVILLTITAPACSVVTVPVKVATKTVSTAVNVVTTTADVLVPDSDNTNAAK